MRRRGVKGGWTRTTRREGRKRERGRRGGEGGGAVNRVAIPSSSKSELPLALISQLIAAALLYFTGDRLELSGHCEVAGRGFKGAGVGG